jgi:hypothetical protein
VGRVSTGGFAIYLGLSFGPELVATALKGTPAKLANIHPNAPKEKGPEEGALFSSDVEGVRPVDIQTLG